MDVDALDGAARLARIEEAGVDDVLDGESKVGVGPHIGRVLAAELEAGVREVARAGDRRHHHAAAGGRAGEADLIDQAGAERFLCRLVRHVKDLEDVLGKIRLLETVGKVLGDQSGLARMFHHDRIAGKNRGQHGVERRHIGEVPGGQIEDDAERLTADEALEALLRSNIDVAEHLRRDRDHVAGALLETPHLARPIADRPPHLPGEQLRHARLVGDHRIDERRADPAPLRNGDVAPVALRLARALERREHRRVVGKRPLGIDRAVDGGDDAKGGGHNVQCIQTSLQA